MNRLVVIVILLFDAVLIGLMVHNAAFGTGRFMSWVARYAG